MPVLDFLIRRIPRSTRRPGSGRADIQGLRAFAVLAVVLDHLFAWPGGGFVGVDVFFVISGFLITGLLLRDQERSGRISFAGFYRRRIRRIIPTAMLVLGVTVVASYLVFNQARFVKTLGDVVWSVFFAGNWRFASLSTDYFSAGGPVSPVQHFWSLGVEEQFYLVWPWVMVLVFAMAAHRGMAARHTRVVVGVAIFSLSVASFLYALWETKAVPDRAYFSTLSRAWELGVGAVLAVWAPALVRLPHQLRPVLAWLGLTGMVASLWVIDPGGGFPAPAAALPVLCTALVLAAGTGTKEPVRILPLTNPVSRYVGDISYSLYLWHFPIIVIGEVLWGDDGVVPWLLGAALLVVSAYSYHLFEDPIRRSRWLEPRRRRPYSRRRLRMPEVSRQYAKVGVSAIAVTCVVLVGFALRTPQPPRSYALPGAGTAGTAVPAVNAPAGLTPHEATLQKEITTALQATSWPKLSPSIESAVSGLEAPESVAQCGNTQREVTEDGCTWGDPQATHRAVVLGDSISMTWSGVLRAGLTGHSGWQVSAFGTFGCPFVAAKLQLSAGAASTCGQRDAEAAAAINRLHPDVVFLSQVPRPLANGSELSAQQWEDTVAAEWAKVSVKTHLVILAPPPRDKDINACYTKQSAPVDCVSKVTDEWLGRQRADEALAGRLHGTYVDSEDWFCTYGACPPFVGSIPTKMDENHMTPAYGAHIAPAVVERLRKLRILTPATT